jgi:DNA gyrase subunit B
LKRKGITLEGYLKHSSAEGKLPISGVKIEKEDHFFYTEKELASFMEQFEENKTKKIEVRDFAESRQIEKIIGKLEENGMSFNTLKLNTKPVYKLQDNGEEYVLFSGYQILEKIKELGRKGLSIQRYKGLGEMNPEQLWETTMDPEKRTLVQIRLEDAYTADEIFNILMGDEVEPRREYIQTHALEVQNLDI